MDYKRHYHGLVNSLASAIEDYKKELYHTYGSYTYIEALHDLITTHSNKKRLLVQTLPNIIQGEPRILYLLSGFNSIVEYPVGMSHPVGLLLSLLNDSPQEMCLAILQTCYHLSYTSDKEIPVFFLITGNDVDESVSKFIKFASKIYKRSLSFVSQDNVIDLITTISKEVYNLSDTDNDNEDKETRNNVSNLAVGSFEWYRSKIKDMKVVEEILEGTKGEMTEVYRDIVDRLIDAVKLGENGSWELLKFSLAHWFRENREKKSYS